ncbi:MAG: hypothetical protein N3A66_02510 [Planctomycetota bacterium]|nr:hypothetical protein [Planctomycetota bacterium]
MVEIGACVNYGIEELKKNPGFQILAAVLIALINGAAGGLLFGPLMLGYYNAMKKIEAGQKPEINDLFSGFSNFLPPFLAALLGGIAVCIGAFLCIIPAFLVMPIIPVAILLVQQGEQDGIAALKRAWSGVSKTLVMAAVTVLVLSLLGSLGSILCGIGVFLTMPIALAGMYKMAQQISVVCDTAA